MDASTKPMEGKKLNMLIMPL